MERAHLFPLRPLRRAAAVSLCAAALLGSCASSARHATAPPPLVGRPRVALLPLENLSGQSDASDRLGRILLTELVRTNCCEVAEPGQVEDALAELRIRTTGSLSSGQLDSLAHRLAVTHVMLGSVIESGLVRTQEGDVPSVGLTLRLLQADNGRVLWAASRVRTGDDHESVFGWGRERSAERLAGALAADMLKDFRAAPAGASDTTGGHR